MAVEKAKINQILRLIAKGGETGADAVEELYFSMGKIMFSVAHAIVQNTFEAQDVVQNSFVKIVQNADKFRFFQNGYGWVLTIVRNTALNSLKSGKNRPHADVDEFSVPAPSSDPDDKIAVRSALAKLDEKERAVIIMKYYEDKTIRAIAAELGMPFSTVQSVCDRAEKKLKNLL